MPISSVSESGTEASYPTVTDSGRYRNREAHRAGNQPADPRHKQLPVAGLRKDGSGTGTRTEAAAERGQAGDDLGKIRYALIKYVKKASARRSWEDVRAAKEEARSRGLRLDGRVHTAFVHAALDIGGPQAALEAIENMCDDGCVPNLALYNKAISLCGRHSLWEEAIFLLRHALAARGSVRGGQGKRAMSPGSIGVNVVTYSTAMAACCHSGKWENALSLMQEMQAVGIRPDQIAFGTVLSACAMGGQSKKALSLLAEMRRENLRPDVVAYSSAIRACGRGGQWGEALNLLREMEEEGGVTPNILTYTAAVEACGRAGQWKKAIWLLAQVRNRGLRPDAMTLNAVMDALGRAGETEKALALLQTMRPGAPSVSTASWNSHASPASVVPRHGEIASISRKSHLRADVFTWSAGMTACIEGGQWERVAGMLDDMRCDGIPPNVVNYNLAMKALAKGGQWEHAMELLESMKAAGVPPDKRTYCAAIEACGWGGSWERAVSLMGNMRQSGLEPDELIYSTVIAACDRGGAWDVALMVLDEARDGDGDGGGISNANVFAYTAAISACGKAGQWEKAVSLFDVMKKEGVAPNAVTLRTVLQALENAPPQTTETRGRTPSVPDSTRVAFAPPLSVRVEEEEEKEISWADTPSTRVPHGGVKGNLGTRGAGDVASHVPALPWEIAISLLEETARGGDDCGDGEGGGFPTPRDFAAALMTAFFGGAEWASIIKVLDTIHARLGGHHSNVKQERDSAVTAAGGDVVPRETSAAASTVVDDNGARQVEAGKGRGARDLRSEKRAGLVQAYNHAIRACGNAGGADVALALIEEMHRRGVKPDGASYSSAIVACDLAGMGPEALDLLDDMRRNADQEPDLVCYNCAIKACGSSGEWEAALSVVETMRERGVAPDEITYSSAIAACGNGGEVRTALGLLKDMKTKGITAGLITHNAALSACDKGGEWEATVSVLNEMRVAGVRPDVISYSAAMSSSEKAGKWRATLRLYDQLKVEIAENSPMGAIGFHGAGENVVSGEGDELPPPRLTLAALTACARGGEWKRAIEILREAKAKGGGEDGIRSHLSQASSLAYNAAIVACAKGAEVEAAKGREGGWQEAIEILDMMGRSPDPTSYGCAITACGFGGNVEACVGLLSEMIQRNLTPTLADYLASLRACAARGRADAAQEIMGSMASECVEPDARCYRFAAKAFHRSGGSEDRDAESSTQFERFLKIAEEMEANAVVGGLEGARTADIDLTNLDLKYTPDLETLSETTGGSFDFVGSEEM